MTTKQWLSIIGALIVTAVIAAAAEGVVETAQDNYSPVWEGK